MRLGPTAGWVGWELAPLVSVYPPPGFHKSFSGTRQISKFEKGFRPNSHPTPLSQAQQVTQPTGHSPTPAPLPDRHAANMESDPGRAGARLGLAGLELCEASRDEQASPAAARLSQCFLG